MSKSYIAYITQCDLDGCDCDEEDKACYFVPVLIMPLYEEESDEAHIMGRLQFGSDPSKPYTDRLVDSNPIRLGTRRLTT